MNQSEYRIRWTVDGLEYSRLMQEYAMEREKDVITYHTTPNAP